MCAGIAQYTDYEIRVNKIISALYQDCALTSVSSHNDWKFPRKLIHVTNISMSTENQIPKFVYCSASHASRGRDRLIKKVLDLKITAVG